mgnify:CR=1 FL=1
MFRKFSFKRQKKSRVIPAIISENSCEPMLLTKTAKTKNKINNVSGNRKPSNLDMEKEMTM